MLSLEHLSVTFETPQGAVRAVQDVDLTIDGGTIVGLVGESGCGKSTLGRSILRLLPENATVRGSIRFAEHDLLTLSPRQMRDLRGRNLAMIFQDPMTRLNPLMRIRDHFVETIRAHDPFVRAQEALERAKKVLADVRVPSDRLGMYPHELSGGMRQRVMIALCLLFKPALLIADEPTTALDVILEAQILQLLQSIMHQYNMSVLLITHNLGLVAEFADRVAVMYAGRIAEAGATVPLFREPRHPYTHGLLRSVIDLQTTKLYSVPGEPPSLLGESVGCPFYPRCEKRMAVCETVFPEVRLVGEDRRKVACHLY
ncbi:MAG: ABC transporter ATP-binding protein [Methanobacteriota archaeon]|nr:MAG: ABC transporter ATP-binding protein [Euryarchaeota archaeon]TLZ81064.1 MAG: ABC transporter ATP-binding protein [Euryarchaeota archaeon]